MIRIIIALALLTTTASAEILHNGRVYQITADRIIAREKIPCTYGRFNRFVTLADGRTALIRSKVCIKEGTRR